MLKGERVILATLREEDSEKLFQWINDPELVRFNAPYKPVHWNGHLQWFETVTKDASRIILGIRDHLSDSLIGVIQLIDIQPIHKHAELVIRIGDEKFRGQGYGRDSLRLMLDYAWRDLNLHRVWLRVYGTNTAAIAAYKSVHFVEEGRLRQAAYINGRWEDVCVMGILQP